MHFDQIYQPEEEEEVKVVTKVEEDKTKEYEKAAKRLANAQLVCDLYLRIFDLSLRLFFIFFHAQLPIEIQ